MMKAFIQSFSKKQYLIVFVGLICLIVGYLIGITKSSNDLKRLSLLHQECLKDLQKASKEESSPQTQDFVPSEIIELTGKIVEIKPEENTIFVEEIIYPPVLPGKPYIKKWQVKIGEFTELIKRVPMSIEEQEKAQKEGTFNPLEPFKEFSINFSDFKVGLEVTVEPEKAVKQEALSFQAKKVILYPPSPEKP